MGAHKPGLQPGGSSGAAHLGDGLGSPLPCFLAVGSGWCFPRKQPRPPRPQSLEVPASGMGSVVLGVWLPREGRCGSRGVSGVSGGLRQRHMPCTCCRQVTQGTQRASPPSIPGGSAEGSHESRSFPGPPRRQRSLEWLGVAEALGSTARQMSLVLMPEQPILLMTKPKLRGAQAPRAVGGSPTLRRGAGL